ncbi:MAG TPA: glycine cleavage system protein GcvH [Candidatus Deferrimicrobiaceae bacterium]|jgi:glycine cleavage system H protein
MPNTYYTKEHEWVTVDGTSASVGITDFAAHQLGDITFVELPKVGKTVKQFEVLCGIESVKTASDIYAPLSGKVVAVNDALNDTPEVVNASPEESAWMAKLEIADASETSKLMNRDQYLEYLKGL